MIYYYEIFLIFSQVNYIANGYINNNRDELSYLIVAILNMRAPPGLVEPKIFDYLMLQVGLQVRVTFFSSHIYICFQGFFHERTTFLKLLPYPVIDPLGFALHQCFPGVPLEYGLLLLHCASNGCLLSGMIYVASNQAEHSLLKREKNGDRNDLILMDVYRRWTISNKSNAEIYNEIALKYVCISFYSTDLQWFTVNGSYFPNLPRNAIPGQIFVLHTLP